MSYAQTANRANPAAMLGALGVPAAFGAILVLGLAVKVIVEPKLENPDTVFVTPTIPDEPPPQPKPTDQRTESVSQQQTPITPPVLPDTEFTLGSTSPIETLPFSGEVITGPVELGGPVGIPSPMPALPDPIAASPANNPGRWVTDSDYRSTWIRQEMSGVASFALTIDSRGKVSDCTITRSTGHSALDQATCTLIERRAKFDPAKDSYGNPIAGTYRNSVNWKIPE